MTSPAPTTNPTTAAPSLVPTKMPSPDPTANPTADPSPSPTTAAPSQIPTKSPSPDPTADPVPGPTIEPTELPTQEPTIDGCDLDVDQYLDACFCPNVDRRRLSEMNSVSVYERRHERRNKISFIIYLILTVNGLVFGYIGYVHSGCKKSKGIDH